MLSRCWMLDAACLPARQGCWMKWVDPLRNSSGNRDIGPVSFQGGCHRASWGSFSSDQSMSEEYLKRYNRSFIPFRNPVEISSWKPFIKKNWTLNDEVNIVYTGRLAVPNINSLLTYCQVIDELNTIGYRINLHIYSIDTNSSFLAKIKKFKSVYIHKAVKFGQIPALITQFDFAFLPIDFTPKGFKYAQFSVSTKTSEYMISGVPILLFAPGNIALTEYARKNKCMYIVSENDKDRSLNEPPGK